MNVPANLKYSNDHEWCRVEGDTAVIGITDIAQSHAFLPIGGEILEFNDAVDADPAIVNKDAYGEGWLIKVRMSDPAEYDALLSAADYEKLIG